MLNKAILVGRLTADPELRQTPAGVAVSTFRIAVDRRFSAKDGDRKADFITIVCWRQQAEFVCRYFRKGNAIAIDGSIQTRDYVDKSGNNRTAVEVVADNVSFVERKTGGAAGGFDAPPMPTQAPVTYASGDVGDFEEIDGDGDLPF